MPTPVAATEVPESNDGMLDHAADLEFPDWNGMRTHCSQMTFEEAVRWNDEMLSQFPPKKSPAKLEAERRCHAEFIL